MTDLKERDVQEAIQLSEEIMSLIGFRSIEDIRIIHKMVVDSVFPYKAAPALYAAAQLAVREIDDLLDNYNARIDSVTGDCLAAASDALESAIIQAEGGKQ